MPGSGNQGVVGTPLVIAHRGASGYRPEHTASAYRLALALGADAVEPDLVASRDGVLVIRHENEISGTTDVAAHPEFAARRTTREVDGRAVTGWFTEDFTWAELATLRARERLPALRQHSTRFDGIERMLRLEDLLQLLEAHAESTGRYVGLVAEVKHATHFAAAGLPLDELVAAAVAAVPAEALVVESFERTVLDRIRDRGAAGRRVYLLEDEGAPPDLVARHGSAAASYAAQLAPDALPVLAGDLDGISVPKSLVLESRHGVRRSSGLVERAVAAGLAVFTWTLRAENRFLFREHRIGSAKGDHGDWRREFSLLLGTGVSGVFADQPDLALAARDGMG